MNKEEQAQEEQGQAVSAPAANKPDLTKRDYILLVDISGSMGETDTPTGKSRFDYAAESANALARECEKYDDNGITVGVFNGQWTIHENVKAGSTEMKAIFTNNKPHGTTNTAGVLDAVLKPYLATRATAKPITILVITDGEPNSREDVVKVIVDASNKIEDENEIGISFLQVGKDGGCTAFLKMLDDDLVAKHGAKFDIVDTKTSDEMENISLEEVLIEAITD